MKSAVWLFVLCSIVMACKTELNYEDWKAKELAKNLRQDSLFLGIHLNMTSKDFYGHCWQLNKKGILRDGAANTTAYYDLTELKHPAGFEFYPRFTDDVITAMPVSIRYKGWAPWNKHLSASKLIEDVKQMLEVWYDVDFVPIESPAQYGKAYLNISGNRKTIIYYSNDDKVDVLHTDLTAEEDVPNVIIR